MGQKIPPGLVKRGNTWHIQKTICGERIRQSTGTNSFGEAERYLTHLTEEIRKRKMYGERPSRTFNEACLNYLRENSEVKRTIADDAWHIKMLKPWIGDHPLNEIHMGTLQGFISFRQRQGVKTRTINHSIQIVRHILNLAAGDWIDQSGLTWLQSPPRIRFLPERDQRKPYPLDWEEQERLFSELPPHLREMALFKVNTGTREGEVCGLRWEYEVDYPHLQTSVFVIPGLLVKNGLDRVVVLNRAGSEVVGRQRGIHPEFVFTYRGNPIKTINGPAWRKARGRARLPLVRVHDLKHTYGRRLRAAGVPEEDRKDLLGHKTGKSMTTHYSAPEIAKLIAYSNRVCGDECHKSDTIIFLEKKTALLGGS
jgi:integrase